MFSSILRFFGLGVSGVELTPAEKDVLEEFVREVDPKFTLVSDYQKILAQGIRNMVSHAEILAGSLREPVELSLRQFTLDHRLGMFFFSPLSLLQTIQTSRAVAEYFLQPQSTDTVYALLLMRCSEKSRFGICEQNGITRSDVMQRVVSFDQHRIVLAVKDAEALHQAMAQRAIYLQGRAIVARLLAQDSRRVQLQADKTEVGIKLRIAEQGHHSDAVGLKTKMEQIDAELQQLDAGSTLDTRIRCVAKYLDEPDELLRITSFAFCLNRMGVVQDICPANATNRVDFEEAAFFGSEETPEKRVVVPVFIHRDAIRSLEEAVTGGY